ncbi:ABC transporter ATP-binding protein [Roseobacteraceae bacterium NS-SX3]
MTVFIENLQVSLGGRKILKGLSLQLPGSKVSGLIGPNGCGKTTLLRSIAGLLPLQGGSICWQNKPVAEMRAGERARQIAILPQSAQTPEGMQVADLVARGRTPHLRPFRPMSKGDREAVHRAMADVGIEHLAGRQVTALSGGQRQRAWIAMVLAQDTPLVLLDEPTTFLDLPHQVDVLRLARKLSTDHGKTVVMVLHDLNFAARYCDRVVALKEGELVAKGAPGDVLTEKTIGQMFGMACRIQSDPRHNTPVVLPD